MSIEATADDWDAAYEAAVARRKAGMPGPAPDEIEAGRPRSVHPDNNPKTRVGALKCPLHLVPPSAEIALAEALADGAAKYDPYNWREERISTSVYIGAIKRHMAAFVDGEDKAQDSGVHHLAHVMACCALILDAGSIGMLNDDRPKRGTAPELLARYLRTQEEKT